MNFKTLFFIALAAFAFGACGDDDDDGPSRSDLLTTPTWVARVYVEDGVVEPIPVDDCDYDDTIKLTTTTVTIDNNDDTACGGIADEEPIVLPAAFNADFTELYITFFDTDTASITRLTATELWLENVDDDETIETRYVAQ